MPTLCHSAMLQGLEPMPAESVVLRMARRCSNCQQLCNGQE
jgi:hypothetical protein